METVTEEYILGKVREKFIWLSEKGQTELAGKIMSLLTEAAEGSPIDQPWADRVIESLYSTAGIARRRALYNLSEEAYRTVAKWVHDE